MDYQQAVKKLTSINQLHLLRYYDELTIDEKNNLLCQIDIIDLEALMLQQKLLQQSILQSSNEYSPFSSLPTSGNPIDFVQGKEMIAQGLMGCLIVAGGQGTRLRINGPKGSFPVTPYEKKSLFQLFSEKVAAAGRQAKQALPLAIMTSPSNHQETITLFEQHHFFGLNPHQVYFFSQGVLPMLDKQGNLFLKSKDMLAKGPDGNGLALHHFFRSGIWSKWHQQGVRAVNFLVIDNALADPFDAELIGNHERSHNDITVKCISRKNAQEKVGIIAKLKNKAVIIEYSELPESLAGTKSDGSLIFSCANISLFCFNMDFIKKIAQNPTSMSLHKAFKATSYVNENGQLQQSIKPIAWKFETFIFDLLPIAEKVGVLLYPREQCFSPLKNFEGEDSISTVRQALLNNDRRVFLEATGKPYDSESRDIPQDFYYLTPEFLREWKH
ncbi:MAG: UTP--glucose-1-phosphate uridylyltransferase [Parachlamydiaceae bacterium]|nr:UTP--glucose-1-phosphate uridylyltransferase [Parachlamydiaceae bacterium]